MKFVRALVLLALAASVVTPVVAKADVIRPLHIDVVYNATPTPDAVCQGFRVVGAGTADVLIDQTWHTGLTYSDSECANVVNEPGAFQIQGTFTVTDPATGVELVDGRYYASAGMPSTALYVYPSGFFSAYAQDGTALRGCNGSVRARASLLGPATASFDGACS